MGDLIQQCREARALGITKIELSLDSVINLLERIENIQTMLERQVILLDKLKKSNNS